MNDPATKLPPLDITADDWSTAADSWSTTEGAKLSCRERQLSLALEQNEKLKVLQNENYMQATKANAKLTLALELLREYRSVHDCELYEGHGGCSICRKLDASGLLGEIGAAPRDPYGEVTCQLAAAQERIRELEVLVNKVLPAGTYRDKFGDARWIADGKPYKPLSAPVDGGEPNER